MNTAVEPAAVGSGTPSTDPDTTGDRLPFGLSAGYTRVRDTLRANTAVPILTPRRVFGDLNDDSMYVVVQTARRDHYSVIFSHLPICTGESVCRLGTAAGQLRPTPLQAPDGRRVRLPDGRPAFFTPGDCAAGCTDATLEWTAGPYSYYVGLKRGRLDELIPMAASMAPLP